ncbi:hypothetical protein OMCYN_00641 [cyanobiont of Ornithocercus magnificus]|nr:hypothetical protein OMCYN_00641 [cyanobiont of Ornithocercus magnificus]
MLLACRRTESQYMEWISSAHIGNDQRQLGEQKLRVCRATL